MNMLNRNCKTSFVKREFLKKAQRANPRLYDIGCYNDSLALMLAPESDKTIHLAQESRSKLSDLIRSFDYEKLNNLYDLFVPHREKSTEQRYFSERTKMPMAVPISTREPKRTVNQYAATTLKGTVAAESTNQKSRSTIRKQYEHISKTCKWWYCKFTPSGYKWKPKSLIGNVNTNLVEIILFIVDSGCSKHMTRNLKLLTNFVEKFLGSHGTYLYSITLQDTSTPNLICLMAKATSSQAWLWHRRLSHLNFDTINLPSKNDIMIGDVLWIENIAKTAEVEYVSLSMCCAQVLWLRTQLTDYGFHFDKIPMYCDSKATIAISCNPVQHSRTKHIDVRYHFIKEQVEKGIVELFFVGTEYQLADLFTKALLEDRFKYFIRRLGMRCLTPQELEVLANKSA
ncbi:retrovirus-related pol polyprotein from transposon TNT 1-94 [Tanacetum coccineum]